MKRVVLAVLGVASALAVLFLPAVGGAAGSPSMTPVTTAPRVPAGTKDVGAVAAAKAQTGAVVLKPRDRER